MYSIQNKTCLETRERFQKGKLNYNPVPKHEWSQHLGALCTSKGTEVIEATNVNPYVGPIEADELEEAEK